MGCYKGLVSGLAAVVLSAAVGSPALAAIVTIDASAAVDTINDASASDGVQIGDVAHYHVVFDDSTLVDITAAANALYGGSTTGIRVASLSDPGASFTATFDGDTYTQDVSEGVDASGLGVPYPYVIYHGPTFWGFDILVQRGDGFELGLFGEEELSLGEPQTLQGGQDFCCGAGDAPFSGAFDPTAATITSVPEPATWTLMLLAMGGLGCVARGRREAAQ